MPYSSNEYDKFEFSPSNSFISSPFTDHVHAQVKSEETVNSTSLLSSMPISTEKLSELSPVMLFHCVMVLLLAWALEREVRNKAIRNKEKKMTKYLALLSLPFLPSARLTFTFSFYSAPDTPPQAVPR